MSYSVGWELCEEGGMHEIEEFVTEDGRCSKCCWYFGPEELKALKIKRSERGMLNEG